MKLSSQSDVYVAELEADGRALKNPRRLTLDERNDYPSTWTPDSKAVLFESDREGRTNIFQQALDQDSAEPLVTGLGYRWGPKVTPDRAWILYSQDTPGSATRIMRMPISGGPSQVVMEGERIESYRCASCPATVCVVCEQTPDQKQFIFSMLDPLRGKGREVARVNLKPPDPDYGWDLSPDGSRIAFTQYEEGEASIQLIPLAVEGVQKINVKNRLRLRSIN
jgi:Tol biopolymer transport system component